MSSEPVPSDPAGSPLLSMSGIVKDFPGVRALDGVDLEVRAGEVHCLLGQNGAGKSTLIKVLSGAHTPDTGEIRWQGRPVTLSTPTAAINQGIATIYQELDLVDGLSVAENIYLGHEVAPGGITRRRAQNAAAGEVLGRLGHTDISPTREVGTLSSARKQIVSMARALSRQARLIVMDEPSAVLAQDEVENLFRVIRELTGQGVAVVYISHRLEEIRAIGDRLTVLKDGRTVATDLPAASTSTSEVVSLMTGRSIEYVFPPRPPKPTTSRPTLLTVDHLSLDDVVRDVSFTVAEGQIVGIAGLVGSGRSELLETLYGARRRTAGAVTFDGRVLPRGRVTSSVRRGMGLAPEERKSQALLLEESVLRNVSLSSLPHFSRFGWMSRRKERHDVTAGLASLQVRPSDPGRPARTLSGGNQQKVVLARWLLGDTRLLLLDEPTRGVDVGARTELYKLIRQIADDGVGVVVVSSDVPEVLGLADHVLVMRDGTAIHQGPADELDETRVLDMILEGTAA
ncbi:MAG: sugar ABC transporter ATP-binding protein [Nocardioides sp.]|nr:sugar ABC transporter ATP-binding protein [Nocardioides sp.]